MMVAAQVIGNDACITVGGQHGNFELNVMLPVIGYNILQSIELIASCSENFVNKCIDGIEANEDVCRDYAEKSLATCTSLAPVIGYDKAAAIAKQAYKENKTVREVASEAGVLDPAELDKVLNLMSMTRPGA
jgi:fumarate hydratase class II